MGSPLHRAPRQPPGAGGGGAGTTARTAVTPTEPMVKRYDNIVKSQEDKREYRLVCLAPLREFQDAFPPQMCYTAILRSCEKKLFPPTFHSYIIKHIHSNIAQHLCLVEKHPYTHIPYIVMYKICCMYKIYSCNLGMLPQNTFRNTTQSFCLGFPCKMRIFLNKLNYDNGSVSAEVWSCPTG